MRNGSGSGWLAGIECEHPTDGPLDLADECLAALDIVVASVTRRSTRTPGDDGPRAARDRQPARRHPRHPTGRMLSTSSYPIDVEAVIDACGAPARRSKINQSPHRLDLIRRARELARRPWVPIVISSDSHSAPRLSAFSAGAPGRRPARLASSPADVLNTRPFDEFRASLRRHGDRPHEAPHVSTADKARGNPPLYFTTTRQTISGDLARAASTC